MLGCCNLSSINIPSSCKRIEVSAIDCRYETGNEGKEDDIHNQGPLTITFDPGSSIQTIQHSGISNTYILRIYVYDKVYPKTSTYFFGNAVDIKIFSPYNYKFCGYQTTLLDFKTVYRHQYLTKLPLFIMIVFSK